MVSKGGTGKTTLSTVVALGLRGPRQAGSGRRHRLQTQLAVSLGQEEAAADQAPLVPRALVVGSGDGADRLGTRVHPPSGAVRDAVEAIVDFVESRRPQRAALLAEKERIDRRLAELTAVR